jgi:proteasome alpha subunit
MSMPFYVPAEQQAKDKADYARKGIARGRSVVVLQYDEGILFVADNPSRALHKISEIYDRIGFAAVGKYNEFENLRLAGVRYADVTGYQYDRADVTARGLANAYAQTLGTLFTEQVKAYEVELVVAEVGEDAATDQMYRLTFDGSVADEHGCVAMGGQADAVAGALKEAYADGMTLAAALRAAVHALEQQDADRHLEATSLEAAVLDRTREHRLFRRLPPARIEQLLAEANAAAGTAADADGDEGADTAAGTGTETDTGTATGTGGKDGGDGTASSNGSTK